MVQINDRASCHSFVTPVSILIKKFFTKRETRCKSPGHSSSEGSRLLQGTSPKIIASKPTAPGAVRNSRLNLPSVEYSSLFKIDQFALRILKTMRYESCPEVCDACQCSHRGRLCSGQAKCLQHVARLRRFQCGRRSERWSPRDQP